MVGKTLGHYEILEPLGKGGMCEVYRARDTKLDRDVAIKVLPEDLNSDPERRVLADAELAARRRVAIVAGARTPFVKAGKELAGHGPLALAKHATSMSWTARLRRSSAFLVWMSSRAPLRRCRVVFRTRFASTAKPPRSS